MMKVSGRCISEAVALSMIKKGEFATNLRQAISKFGLEYVMISPVYSSCQNLIEQLEDSDEHQEPNCCYVHMPAKLM